MIIGMPGCGKSLTAKATASLFEIPLVRLDVGRLLGKYVGESEENMRNALKLSEAISPCVLWIDEIEKAFAGVGGEGRRQRCDYTVVWSVPDLDAGKKRTRSLLWRPQMISPVCRRNFCVKAALMSCFLWICPMELSAGRFWKFT